MTEADDDEMDRRAFRLMFAVIVAAAAVFRIGYVLAAKRGEALVGDQIYYSAQAVTIANGRWFEDPFIAGAYAADHAPLTALVLAPVSWSDANPFLVQRLLMACIGVVVVAGVGVLARWLFGRRVALAAAALATIYANLWMNDGLLMSETLAAVGVVGVLGAVYVYDLRRDVRWAVVIGVVLGVAGLARAELLLLGPLVVMPLTLGSRRAAWSTGLRHLTIAAAVTVTVLSPWVVRNLIRFEDTTLISTQDGYTLLGANCPDTYHGPGVGFWSLQCADLVTVPDGADQSERSTLYREFALDYIAEERSEIPRVVLARLGRGLSLWETDGMTYLNTGEGRETWASNIGLWQFWVLTPMAAWGWWRWPSRQPRWPALVTAGLSVLVIVVFYGIPRFRIPAEVVIVLGAAITLETVATRVWRSLRRTPAPDDRSASPPRDLLPQA